MRRLKAMESRSYIVLAGLALTGFCISLFAYHTIYTNRRKKLQAMQSAAARANDKKKVRLPIIIDQGHLDWLQQCSDEFELPDVDKALRILLTYAHHCVDEMLIFEQIRCNFCKDKQKLERTFIIELGHDNYLVDMVSKHKLANKNKAVRIIIDYAISSDDKSTIFGVKRCSHPDTCKNC